MPDSPDHAADPLDAATPSGLPRDLTDLADAAGDGGWLRTLGERHAALHRAGSDVLIVEFEELSCIRARPEGLPWSTGMARKRGWASLTVMASGRTWYRAPEVIELFDTLTDNGFFDDYGTVMFVGAGPAGYAAAAYSVAAPGAVVFLMAPYATLDRDIVPWERRFRHDWALPFGPRYGYAPHMLDAASRVFVVSDPTEAADAAHASLFLGRHITHLPARHAGAALRARLEAMGLLDRLAANAVSGTLSPLRWAQLWRARHGDEEWRMNVLRKLDTMRRPWLQAVFAGAMMDAGPTDAARRRLNDALSQLRANGRGAPPGREPVPLPGGARAVLAGE